MPQPLDPTSATTALGGDDPNMIVSDDGRNGLITAIGIILGFTLTYYTSWAMGEDRFRTEDWIPTLLFILSIVLQVLALYSSLLPYRQSVARYTRTVRKFIAAVAL